MTTPAVHLSLDFNISPDTTIATLTRVEYVAGTRVYRMLKSWRWSAFDAPEGIERLMSDLMRVWRELDVWLASGAEPEAPREPLEGRWGEDQPLPFAEAVDWSWSRSIGLDRLDRDL